MPEGQVRYEITRHASETYARMAKRGLAPDESGYQKQLARDWLTSEDRQTYQIGCPDWGDREALIFLVEAARALCSMRYDDTIKLAESAVAHAKREKATWPKGRPF